MNKHTPSIEPLDAYTKVYKMRALGKDEANTVVSIPPEVVEREARKRNLTVAEFLEQYRAIAHYNNFDGVLYRFEQPPTRKKKQSK